MAKFGFGERGEGVDRVVECSGAEVCVQTGIWLVKRRGTCVQVGAGPPDNLIPMSIFVNKEVRLIGSLRVSNAHVWRELRTEHRITPHSTARAAMLSRSTLYAKDGST
jgi:threonine dehydrogenase-like Zn-dependent dehydrogenase